MDTADARYYRALSARDPRFDGVFFVGVTSTGIYCRPICPARTPKKANCRFFANAEAAEKHHFRPCLRCRPELAPGAAPVDDARRITHLLAQRVAEGLADEQASLEDVAAQFELSTRQVRRIVHNELGVSPIQLLQSRRLLLAKQLLTETSLPITEIAFASGFSSLRRFNDAFLSRYKMPPTRLRRDLPDGAEVSAETGTSVVQLVYRPPYDWPRMLEFLQARAMGGVEWIADAHYCRTVRLGACKGWIRVGHDPERRALQVQFTHALTPVLPALLGRLRNLFDLSAQPDLIDAHLSTDARLKKIVRNRPGLRVPGAFDGFELAVRAILGQQVTVAGASTLASRFAAAFGEKFKTPFPALCGLTPTAEIIAKTRAQEIAKIGVIKSRATAIVALARAVVAGTLQLDAGGNPQTAIVQLMALPGVGPWTAHYIAMRALSWPDAFPKEDVAVRKFLGGVTAEAAEHLSQDWRPWRSYAVLHMWQSTNAFARRRGSGRK